MRLSIEKFRWILILTLILMCITFMLVKVIHWGFEAKNVMPITSYNIDLDMSMDGNGKNLFIKSFLPIQSKTLTINSESFSSESFYHTTKIEGENKIINWIGKKINGKSTLNYSANVSIKTEEFLLPEFVTLNVNKKERYLKETKKIQVNSPEVDDLIMANHWDTLTNVITIAEKIYHYTHDEIKNANFSGETDALITLKLGEGSCNGKSRLAVALLRHLKVEARLVGGIILNPGSKKTIHQWVEVWMGNKWVPFDPLNGHIFKIPSNYLRLYTGDEALFSRSANANFEYKFTIQKKMIAQKPEKNSRFPRYLNLRYFLGENGVNMNTISILLMIPFGALITVIFRNMIGVATFGTFLPVLIAVSYQDTGLYWGNIGFVGIIVFGAVLRVGLDKLKLLHTPKLTVILVMVILMIMALLFMGVIYDIPKLKQGHLFPIAVLAITIERFGIIWDEQGIKPTILMLLNTLIVVSFCYMAMLSIFLQTLILAFPEILLIVVALSLYLGRWTGIRYVEFYRFRNLIFKKHEGENA